MRHRFTLVCMYDLGIDYTLAAAAEVLLTLRAGKLPRSFNSYYRRLYRIGFVVLWTFNKYPRKRSVCSLICSDEDNNINDTLLSISISCTLNTYFPQNILLVYDVIWFLFGVCRVFKKALICRHFQGKISPRVLLAAIESKTI